MARNVLADAAAMLTSPDTSKLDEVRRACVAMNERLGKWC